MKKIVIVLIGMVCLLSNIAFSAGVHIDESFLSGNVNLPGLWANYSSYNWGDTSWASVSFALENSIPGGASWNFYTYSDDPSKWNANLHLNGWYLEDGVAPDSFEKSQNSSINPSDVYLTNSLYIDYSQKKGEAFLSIYASHSTSPAIITSTSFLYHESNDPWRDLTRWNVDYYVRGYFVADTLAEAQAMGAPFVLVPEPATVLLLGLGVISLMRRRPKS